MIFLPTNGISEETIERNRRKTRKRLKKKGSTNGTVPRNHRSRSLGCRPEEVDAKNAELNRRGITSFRFEKGTGDVVGDGQQTNRAFRRFIKRHTDGALVNLDDNL